MDASGIGHTLVFLGTAGSCGVPSFYCGCKACQEALSDPSCVRNCSGLAIRGQETILIDTPPGLNLQLSRAGIDDVDGVLFTHQHQDHTGGLPDLEYLAQLKHGGRPLPLYCSDIVAALLPTRFEWMMDCFDIRLIQAFQPLELDGVVYTPLPATHAPGTFGFLLESKEGGGPSAGRAGNSSADGAGGTDGSSLRRTAYFPDTGPLPEETLAYLQGIDRLILDATFNGRNWMPQSHHSVDEALEVGRALEVGELFLTHLTMHYDTPTTTAELQAKLAVLEEQDISKTHFHLAQDGMQLSL